MTPSTQKDRPISFMLWDNLASAQLAQIGLVIRPEELTRTDPSRINDTQTLGGAVFACKDDTLYSVPKAHNRTTTHFLTTPIFINRLLSEAHFEAFN